MRRLLIQDLFSEGNGYTFIGRARNCEDPNQQVLVYDDGDFPGECVVVMGEYVHYKGGHYDLLGIADFEGNESVVYRALYETEEFPLGTMWVRSLEDFVGYKEIDGKKVKRFSLVE
jgi:hypothetical protein